MKNTRADLEAAVAISYDHGASAAPKVVASGYGEIAKRILDIAKSEKIHIHNDDNLAQLLARVPVGTEIPEESYQLIAELLAFVYNVDKKVGQGKSK